MNKTIGRFEVLRELGRGAQSVVYLARDPHLEREVAIKTMHFTRPDPQLSRRLLEEARLVSQMRHPAIVPIFEAGEADGDIYLVFEYVPGKTLADYVRESGALPPARAVALLQPVLEALSHAHGQGVIHRDLKPSNILISDEGLARVMDFGIAARIAGKVGDGDDFTGTPAYMAPEYITSHVVNEQTDIFAAGLILYELLTGRRAIQGSDVYSVMNRIANEDVRLPKEAEKGIDERISSVVLKAVARDPDQRYATVAQMSQALEEYLDPEQSSGSVEAKQSTIDFLLRRMRHKSDFPALSESVSAINKITASENESVAKLSGSILKDFALTNKILKIVNSAYFRQSGGGNVSTVSRAVMVLGFDAVRNIAITVMLFEHLQNKGNANQLKDEFLRANFAGLLGREIGAKTAMRDVEQSFICSMFNNLGRLLAQYYFPEEVDEIKRLTEQKDSTEASATIQVLGLTYEELGIGIARHWGFPNVIVASMRSLPPGPVRKPTQPEEKLRLLASVANEVCAVVSSAPAGQRQKEVKKVLGRYGSSLPLDEQALTQTVEKAIEEAVQFANIIHLNVNQTPFGRKMKSWGSAQVRNEAAADDAGGATTRVAAGEGGDGLTGSVLRDAPGLSSASPDSPDDAEPVNAEAILAAGIQDISNTLVEDFSLNDVLRIILETMYRAKGFRRVILCIKDARNNVMQGRFGFGPDAAAVAKLFRFPLSFTPDIFHAAMSKGVDVLISDTRDPKIAQRIPEWFRKASGAGTFVVFPLLIKGNPVALIYADKDFAGDIQIPEKELSLMRTLRNQAVLAIKQSM